MLRALHALFTHHLRALERVRTEYAREVRTPPTREAMRLPYRKAPAPAPPSLNADNETTTAAPIAPYIAKGRGSNNPHHPPRREYLSSDGGTVTRRQNGGSSGGLLTPKNNKAPEFGALSHISGGEPGIRTLGTLACSTDFESVPFDHSGNSPVGAHDSSFAPTDESLSGLLSC